MDGQAHPQRESGGGVAREAVRQGPRRVDFFGGGNIPRFTFAAAGVASPAGPPQSSRIAQKSESTGSQAVSQAQISMKRLLLDLSVVLDVLLDTRPHVTASAAVWAAVAS